MVCLGTCRRAKSSGLGEYEPPTKSEVRNSCEQLARDWIRLLSQVNATLPSIRLIFKPSRPRSQMSDDQVFRLILLAGFVIFMPDGIYHRLKARTGERLDCR